MQDTDMPDANEELFAPMADIHYLTDEIHIRGINVIDLIKDNSLRIPWTSADKIILVAHCVRYQLHLGNYDTLALDDLVQRLGLWHFCQDSTYRDVLVKKMRTAIKYRLDMLHKGGHVILAMRKPYHAEWKPYTRPWALEGWDGQETIQGTNDAPPDSAPATAPAQTIAHLPLESHIQSMSDPQPHSEPLLPSTPTQPRVEDWLHSLNSNTQPIPPPASFVQDHSSSTLSDAPTTIFPRSSASVQETQESFARLVVAPKGKMPANISKLSALYQAQRSDIPPTALSRVMSSRAPPTPPITPHANRTRDCFSYTRAQATTSQGQSSSQSFHPSTIQRSSFPVRRALPPIRGSSLLELDTERLSRLYQEVVTRACYSRFHKRDTSDELKENYTRLHACTELLPHGTLFTVIRIFCIPNERLSLS